MNPKKILLIITGSVACYKSLELIRLLRKNNYEVNCVLSKGAKEFITPLLVSALSGTKTYDDLFDKEDEVQMGHINLSRANDLIVIAPASADFIAKIANGYADDLASASVLASNKNIIFAPAMNEKMWNNLATQENIAKIEKIGYEIIEPQKDILACGEEGVGKMVDIEKIFENIAQYFQNKDEFVGKNILITLGGTI
ncbi:MAG: bifunctional phosphopantothenoylcysteine decarboxylase/phosphopantothenate--cysteine ligase CoaBC, partial [Alphaproteobacteria bacterium]